MKRRHFLKVAGLSAVAAATGKVFGKAKKCESCGAPLKGQVCEYCGTEKEAYEIRTVDHPGDGTLATTCSYATWTG